MSIKINAIIGPSGRGKTMYMTKFSSALGVKNAIYYSNKSNYLSNSDKIIIGGYHILEALKGYILHDDACKKNLWKLCRFKLTYDINNSNYHLKYTDKDQNDRETSLAKWNMQGKIEKNELPNCANSLIMLIGTIRHAVTLAKGSQFSIFLDDIGTEFDKIASENFFIILNLLIREELRDKINIFFSTHSETLIHSFISHCRLNDLKNYNLIRLSEDELKTLKTIKIDDNPNVVIDDVIIKNFFETLYSSKYDKIYYEDKLSMTKFYPKYKINLLQHLGSIRKDAILADTQYFKATFNAHKILIVEGIGEELLFKKLLKDNFDNKFISIRLDGHYTLTEESTNLLAGVNKESKFLKYLIALFPTNEVVILIDGDTFNITTLSNKMDDKKKNDKKSNVLFNLYGYVQHYKNDKNLSESNSDDKNISKSNPDDENVSKSNPDDENVSKSNPDDENVSKSNPDDENVSKSNPDNENISELNPDDENVSKSNPDDENVSKSNPDDENVPKSNSNNKNVSDFEGTNVMFMYDNDKKIKNLEGLYKAFGYKIHKKNDVIINSNKISEISGKIRKAYKDENDNMHAFCKKMFHFIYDNV